MGYQIFTVIILAAACFGLLFKKNGELAGLGRESKRGGLRAPHGRLIRTKRLDSVEYGGFKEGLVRLTLILGAITVVLVALGFFGVCSLVGMVGVSLDVLLVIAAAVVLAHSDAGIWQPVAYAVAGYLIPGILLAMLWVAGVPFIGTLETGAVNALTMVFGTLGTAVAVAWMPVSHTYAREFEDGYVNVIQVAHRSVACKAYEALADPSWKPPADRIADYEAAKNMRSRERRG